MSIQRTTFAWAIRWTEENYLDGFRQHLIGTPDHPSKTRLFGTRREARSFLKEHYGYIAARPDLRKEPFGWHIPAVVRVAISVAEVAPS